MLKQIDLLPRKEGVDSGLYSRVSSERAKLCTSAQQKKITLSVDAIRFCERNSLLPRPPRTPAGFRQYTGAVETLAYIRRVQSLGFRLREIRDLLGGNRLQPWAPDAPPLAFAHDPDHRTGCRRTPHDLSLRLEMPFISGFLASRIRNTW